jgi:hypothetical protein
MRYAGAACFAQPTDSISQISGAITMSKVLRFVLIGAAIGIAGCDTGPKGAVGFTLPNGDVERGKASYVSFRCNACHDSAEVPQLAESKTAGISIQLGGETTRIRTYGELVTSIINPSHRVARRNSREVTDESGESRMVNFNDVMTVTQMIDLVAFVQSLYTLSPYKTTAYPVYWLPDSPGSEGK